MKNLKKTGTRAFALLGLLAFVPAQLASADIVVYPAKGQSEKQQQADKEKCESWAEKQTGIDPKALAAQNTAQPGSTGGETVRGAGRGAAAGAIGGAIGGDAGKGAAIGAGVGAAAGVGAKARRNREAQVQEQQAQNQKQQQLAELEKAEKTCLQGKGYSVS